MKALLFGHTKETKAVKIKVVDSGQVLTVRDGYYYLPKISIPIINFQYPYKEKIANKKIHGALFRSAMSDEEFFFETSMYPELVDGIITLFKGNNPVIQFLN